MEKLIIVVVLIGCFFCSCRNDIKIKNPKVEMESFTVTALKLEKSFVTLAIVNEKGEKFAYAERSQTQSGMITYSEIRFSKTNCDTIVTLIGSAIYLYEFINDENGKIMLKDAGYMPLVGGTFEIY